MIKLSRLINKFLSVFNLRLSKLTTVQQLNEKVIKLNDKLFKLEQFDSNSEQQVIADFNSLKVELLQHQITLHWSQIDFIENKIVPQKNQETCPLCFSVHDVSEMHVFQSYCIFGGGLLRRYQCPACDIIFGPEKMLSLSDDQLEQDYKWHYTAYSEGDSTTQEIRAFHNLNPVKSGVYLNYGSGSWSKSIQTLRSEGWDVYGYEPHSEKQSGSSYIITSEEALRKFKFDGIFSNNVLEHFNKPVEELKNMRSILSTNGVMSHATPCFEYLYPYTRFHLFFYLGSSRRILFENAELDIVDYIVDGEFMNVIAKAKKR